MSEKPAAAAIDPLQTHVAAEWKYARPLISCRFDPQGRFVFTGAEENALQRWNLTDERVTPLAAHDSWARAIGHSPDGQTLYSGGFDGRLVWWPAAVEKPQPLRSVEAHDGWLRDLAVSPDGRLIATAGNDRRVKLWDAADGSLRQTFEGHATNIYSVAFHPSGEHLVSGDLKGKFRHWEVGTGKLVREFDADALHKYDTVFHAEAGGLRCLLFSADGRNLAAGGMTSVTNAFAGLWNPTLVVFDWESGKVRQQHVLKEPTPGLVWGAAWHPDGYWVGVSCGQGGWLLFWKPDEQHEFFKLKLRDGGRGLSLAPDGRRVAVAHADGNLRIYALTAKASA